MPCILRAFGKNFDAAKYVEKSPFKGIEKYLKGEPRYPFSKPDGPKNRVSGIMVRVSSGDFDNLPSQITDAILFAKKYSKELGKLVNVKGVETVAFDFGIYKRDVMGQFDYFPSELLLLLGRSGVGLELSQYVFSDDPKTGRRKKTGTKSA